MGRSRTGADRSPNRDRSPKKSKKERRRRGERASRGRSQSCGSISPRSRSAVGDGDRGSRRPRGEAYLGRQRAVSIASSDDQIGRSETSPLPLGQAPRNGDRVQVRMTPGHPWLPGVALSLDMVREQDVLVRKPSGPLGLELGERGGSVVVAGASPGSAAADVELTGYLGGLARFEDWCLTRLTALRASQWPPGEGDEVLLCPPPAAYLDPPSNPAAGHVRRCWARVTGIDTQRGSAEVEWGTPEGPVVGRAMTATQATSAEAGMHPATLVEEAWWTAAAQGDARRRDDELDVDSIGGTMRGQSINAWWNDRTAFLMRVAPPDPPEPDADMPDEAGLCGQFAVQVLDHPRVMWTFIRPDSQAQLMDKFVKEQLYLSVKTVENQICEQKKLKEGESSEELQHALERPQAMCDRFMMTLQKKHEKLDKLLKNAFHAFDDNGDGILQQEELSAFLDMYILCHRTRCAQTGRQVYEAILDGAERLQATGRIQADDIVVEDAGEMTPRVQPHMEPRRDNKDFRKQLGTFADDIRALLRPGNLEKGLREIGEALRHDKQLVRDWTEVLDKDGDGTIDWEGIKRGFVGARADDFAGKSNEVIRRVCTDRPIFARELWVQRPEGMPLAPLFFAGWHLMPLLPPVPLGLLADVPDPEDGEGGAEDEARRRLLEAQQSGTATTIISLLLGTMFLVGIWLISSYGGLPQQDKDNIAAWTVSSSCQVVSIQEDVAGGQVFDQIRGVARVKYKVGTVSHTELTYDNTMKMYDIFKESGRYFVETFKATKRYPCWYQTGKPKNVRLWARTPAPWRVCELTGYFCLLIGGGACLYMVYKCLKQCKDENEQRKKANEIQDAEDELRALSPKTRSPRGLSRSPRSKRSGSRAGKSRSPRAP